MADCDEIYETKAKVLRYSFKWIVRNFSDIIDEPSNLSSMFSVPGYPLQGILKLFIRGVDSKGVVRVSEIEYLYLDVRADLEDDAVHSEIEVSVLNSKGVKCLLTKKIITSQTDFHLPFSQSFIKKGDSLLPSDSLTLCFSISITTDVVTNRRDNIVSKSLVDNSFERDLEKLFNNPSYSDVTITIGERKFFALKGILATRSSVFASMFEEEVNEYVNNIDITDLTEEVFEEVLYFIYTDQVRNLDAMRDQLLHAAQKFELPRLVHLTEHALLKKLAVDNVCDRLIVADQYKLDAIKIAIIRFIKGQVKAVVQTQGYKTLSRTHCALALEIFHTMALE